MFTKLAYYCANQDKYFVLRYLYNPTFKDFLTIRKTSYENISYTTQSV